MTKTTFQWRHRYELESVTRDHGLSFLSEDSRYSIVVRETNSPSPIQLEIFKGKYRGLNRRLARIELSMAKEDLIQQLRDKGLSLEIQIGDAQDYFETKRTIQYQWLQTKKPERGTQEDSFAS